MFTVTCPVPRTALATQRALGKYFWKDERFNQGKGYAASQKSEDPVHYAVFPGMAAGALSRAAIHRSSRKDPDT